MFIMDIAELTELIHSSAENCTMFISVNDAASWPELMRALSDTCAMISISEDCACADTPPILNHTVQRLKKSLQCGDTMCLALEACLRLTHLPGLADLLDWILAGKARKHRLILPLLACPEWFMQQLDAAQAASGQVLHYELAGEREGLDVCAFAASLEPPMEFADGLRAYFASFESTEPPRTLYVRTGWPLLFNSNWHTRCCTRAYSAIKLFTNGFELLEQRGSTDDWAALLPYADDIVELAEECSESPEAGLSFSPETPLHFAQLMLAAQSLSDSEYLFCILQSHSAYPDLDCGAALAIFDMHPDGSKHMLELRCQRARLIRELGMEHMPDAYWRRLEEIDRRSKLLYTSLVTEDERRFCENYLLNDYHLSCEQLMQREDLRALFPEMLADRRLEMHDGRCASF